MKWNLERSLVVILSLLSFGLWAQAQNPAPPVQAPASAPSQDAGLLERSFAGVSKETNPQLAKRDIQDQAANKISEDVIKDLIGEDRYAKNRSLILSKVVKNSGRYIPFVKPSELTQEGDTFKMSVSLKVSLKDLKQILQDNSLLSENDTAPVVLPLVSWVDRNQMKTYNWWQPSDKDAQVFLMKENRHLEEALRGSFQKNNFYVIKPASSGLAGNVPTNFQDEKIAGEDAQFFAQYFNAPVVLDGQVQISKGDDNRYRLEIRMSAIQVSNNRPIADVSRKFETESGSYENVVDKKIKEVSEAVANDLASQVFEAWQRGSLGTSVLLLTVRGKNNLPLDESLKDRIRTQITQVKNIRERMISSDSVSFEIDTASPAAEISQKILALDLGGKKLNPVSENNNELVLQWAE